AIAESEGLNGATALATMLIPASKLGQSVVVTATATDSLGRITSASRTYVVQPDGAPPTVAFGAATPPTSAAEDSLVSVTASASDPDNDVARVEVFADGVSIGSSNTNSLSTSFRLPLLSTQASVSFEVVATDARGREARVSRVTTLTPNQGPTVAFVANEPPGAASEGGTITVHATAVDPEGRLASLELFADGVSIGASSAGDVTVQFVLPLLANRSSVSFEAVARDVLGLEARATRVTTIQGNSPAVITFTPALPFLIVGETQQLCSRAVDAGGLQSLSMSINGVAVASSATSCGAGCLQRCNSTVVPLGATVEVTALAIDALGRAAANSHSYPVRANQPPVPSGVFGPLVLGRAASVSIIATDERPSLAWIELRVNGFTVGGRTLLPVSGSAYARSLTPSAAGDIEFDVVAEDLLGAQATTHYTRRVGIETTVSYISETDFSLDDTDLVVNGRTLTIDGVHRFASLQVTGSGVVTHSPQDGTAVVRSLDLDVTGDVVIESGSSIDVSGRGYLGANRPGNPDNRGRTLGNAFGHLNSSGTYGGFGYNDPGVTPNAVYGDFKNPNELGTGGAARFANGDLGGNGGGLLRLKANRLVLNGELRANGQSGNWGGSGGGIRVETTELSGTGLANAEGGYYSGGGRIAFFYTTNLGFNLSRLTAGNGNAGAGTVFTKSASQSFGELVFSVGRADVITEIAGGDFDRLRIAGNAAVRVTGPVFVSQLELAGGLAQFDGLVTTPQSAVTITSTTATFSAGWPFIPGV
ncbi:MAG: Ig-like domain-containing protein, partial [Vicinamibacterales bacterium]